MDLRITVRLPRELLQKARNVTGKDATKTIRLGLELLAASPAYSRLLKLRGKVRFSKTVAQLKADR